MDCLLNAYLCRRALAAPGTESGAFEPPTQEHKAWPLRSGRSQPSFMWETNPHSKGLSARTDKRAGRRGNKAHDNKVEVIKSV